MRDQTLCDDSLYGSNGWVAQRLGLTKDTFFRKRDTLEVAGFPTPDPITSLYIKADVDAWVKQRRQVSDGVKVSVNAPMSTPNFDRI